MHHHFGPVPGILSPVPPPMPPPDEAPGPVVLTESDAVQALLDVGHLASKQEQVAALQRRGIVLVKITLPS